MTPSDVDFNARRDVQLFAAIEFLRGNAQGSSDLRPTDSAATDEAPE